MSDDPSARYYVADHHPENGTLLGFWLYLMSDCLLFAGMNYWFPKAFGFKLDEFWGKVCFWCWLCLLYTSPSPRDRQKSRMPSSA